MAKASLTYNPFASLGLSEDPELLYQPSAEDVPEDLNAVPAAVMQQAALADAPETQYEALPDVQAAQEKADFAQLLGGVLGGLQTANSAFGVSPNNAPASIAAYGQGKLAQALDAERGARSRNAALAEQDPNTARAKALRTLLAAKGLSDIPLGAGDIEKAGLVGQAFTDAREESRLKSYEEQARIKAESDAKKAAEARAQQEYLVRLRAALKRGAGGSGKGGGASKIAELQGDKEYLLKLAGGDPTIAAGYAVLPRDEFVKTVQQGGAIKASVGAADRENRLAADYGGITLNKHDKDIADNRANAIGQELSKAGVAGKLNALDRLEDAFAEHPQAAEFIAKTGVVGSFADRLLSIPGITKGNASNIQSLMDQYEEIYARPISGAAIGSKEWDKFKSELGSGKLSSVALIKQGLQRVRDDANRQIKGRLAAAGIGGALAAQRMAGNVLPEDYHDFGNEILQREKQIRDGAVGQAVEQSGGTLSPIGGGEQQVVVEMNGKRKPVSAKSAAVLVKKYGATIVK